MALVTLGNEVCLASRLCENKWFIDSGCSRHMTGDANKFNSIAAYDGGYVIFGDNSKVQNQSEITEEENDETHSKVEPEIQKDRIRQIINYQKSLYSSCSSSSSFSSSAVSYSSSSSTGKRSSLLNLMQGGSTSLSRLFDMEHTPLSRHFSEYSGSPIIKPICLWGSDEDEVFQGSSPWAAALKTFRSMGNGSGLGSLNGSPSDITFAEGESDSVEKQTKRKRQLMRTKSFRSLPGYSIWRCRGFGFRMRLKRLKIMICGRKF